MRGGVVKFLGCDWNLELHPKDLVPKSSLYKHGLVGKEDWGHDTPLLFSKIVIGVSCPTMICLFLFCCTKRYTECHRDFKAMAGCEVLPPFVFNRRIRFWENL